MPTLSGTLYYSFYDYLFPPIEPGKQWRERAAAEAHLRSRALDQAQVAWSLGNKEESKRLSETGKAHGREMEHYNSLAEKAIFAHHNSVASDTLKEVDLHGLYVNEAIHRAQAHLDACRKARVKRTTFITGRGKGSVDGVPKIKIAVQGLLGRQGVEIDESNTNEGTLVAIFPDGVDLAAENDWTTTIGETVAWALKGTISSLFSLVGPPRLALPAPPSTPQTPRSSDGHPIWSVYTRTFGKLPGAYKTGETESEAEPDDDADWEVIQSPPPPSRARARPPKETRKPIPANMRRTKDD